MYSFTRSWVLILNVILFLLFVVGRVSLFDNLPEFIQLYVDLLASGFKTYIGLLLDI